MLPSNSTVGRELDSNVSYDGDVMEELGVYPFTETQKLGWFIAYSIIGVLSVSGNLLVIYVVLRRKSVTVDNLFIINLAIADVLTGLIAAPFRFQAALLQRWNLPSFMCQLLPFIDTLSLGVCVMTLTVCAIDRFFIVFLPSAGRLRVPLAKHLIILIWVFSVICSAPFGILHRTISFNIVKLEPVNSTFEEEFPNQVLRMCLPIYVESKIWRAYNVYLTIIQYFCPLIIIDGVYLAIGCKISVRTHATRKNTTSQSTVKKNEAAKNRKKVMLLLALVVLLFTCCWLPYETYLLLSEVHPSINDFYYINVVFMSSHCLAMSNSCVNPFIYGIFNRRFRSDYRKFFCKLIRAPGDYATHASNRRNARRQTRKDTRAARASGLLQMENGGIANGRDRIQMDNWNALVQLHVPLRMMDDTDSDSELQRLNSSVSQPNLADLNSSAGGGETLLQDPNALTLISGPWALMGQRKRRKSCEYHELFLE